jgi:nitrite reductase/ring-hydroxylating ferredoxin subunit
MREIHIANVATMNKGDTSIFTFRKQGKEVRGFLIQTDQGPRAYFNACMHWPVPLDMGDSEFYSSELGGIVCKTHGAIYNIETGICESGPCVGAPLERFSVRLDNEDAYVTIPEDS